MSEELRRLANEATPGPWNIRGDSIYYSTPHRELLANNNFGGDDGIVRVNATGRYGRWPHDAAYIAAASPDVILGLLDRIAELERVLGTIVLLTEGAPGPLLSNYRAEIENVARQAARSSSKVETGVEK